jgi:hypothetical protein
VLCEKQNCARRRVRIQTVGAVYLQLLKMPTPEKRPTDAEIEARVDACIRELMDRHGRAADLSSAVMERVFTDTIPTDRQLAVMKERIEYWLHPEARREEEADEDALNPANLGWLLAELAESMRASEIPGVVEARTDLEEAARSWDQQDKDAAMLKAYLAANELWIALRRQGARPQ